MDESRTNLDGGEMVQCGQYLVRLLRPFEWGMVVLKMMDELLWMGQHCDHHPFDHHRSSFPIVLLVVLVLVLVAVLLHNPYDNDDENAGKKEWKSAVVVVAVVVVGG